MSTVQTSNILSLGTFSHVSERRGRLQAQFAAMFHLTEELAAEYPILNGQINAGWLAHYQRPIHVDNILQPRTTGEFGWDEEEVEWLV